MSNRTTGSPSGIRATHSCPSKCKMADSLLTAKTRWSTTDSATSVVATANMDRRSFELNFEVNLVVFDSMFTRRLRAVQQSYIDDSDPVELGAWRRRGWSRRLTENALGVLAPLL